MTGYYCILQQLIKTHDKRSDARTCMTVCYLAGFSVPEAMRAEVKNNVAVIRKSPKSQVYQVGQFIHGLNVGISSTGTTKQSNEMSFSLVFVMFSTLLIKKLSIQRVQLMIRVQAFGRTTVS